MKETTRFFKKKKKAYGTEEEPLEINDVYEMIETGPAQFLYLSLVSLVAYSDYAELTLLSVILPSLKCEWGLSPNFEAITTVSVFGSYAIFAILFGKIGDKLGRSCVMKWSLVVLILAAVATALAPNKWVFLLGRLITGAMVGINFATVVCFSTECIKNRYRAFGVMVAVFSSFVGMFAVNLLAFAFLNMVGWRWFIMIVTIPAFPALILVWTLPESPRYLVVSGQQEEAVKAVKVMAKWNSKSLPENIQLIDYSNEERGTFRQVFNKENRKSVFCLSAIYFFNIFMEFGLIIFLPLLFSSNFCGTTGVDKGSCRSLDQEDLSDLSISSAASMLGSIIGLILAHNAGRILPFRASSFFLAITVVLLQICVNRTYMLTISSIIKGFEAMLNAIVWITIPESFPTVIRSTATGFINACGKTGGVIGTGMVYMVFQVDASLVIWIFVGTAVLGFITAMIYNKETKDVVLEEIQKQDYENEPFYSY